MQSGRIGADEAIDDSEGKGAEELEERLQEKEAKTQAILLEMVRRTARRHLRRRVTLPSNQPCSPPSRWATSPTQT